jgi:hypothetical protein
MNQKYQERVFSGILTALPAAFGLILLGIYFYTRLSGTYIAPTTSWLSLGIGLLLILVAINFAFLVVKISSEGVSVRFGIFHHRIPLDNIAGFYQDKTSSVTYGGFGIRFGWVNGKRRLVYNVASFPRMVIQPKNESNREFVFSTRDPEGLKKALKEILKKQ